MYNCYKELRFGLPRGAPLAAPGMREPVLPFCFLHVFCLTKKSSFLQIDLSSSAHRARFFFALFSFFFLRLCKATYTGANNCVSFRNLTRCFNKFFLFRFCSRFCRIPYSSAQSEATSAFAHFSSFYMFFFASFP